MLISVTFPASCTAGGRCYFLIRYKPSEVPRSARVQSYQESMLFYPLSNTNTVVLLNELIAHCREVSTNYHLLQMARLMIIH